MILARYGKLWILLLSSLIILGVLNAFAATNTVPSLRLDDDSFSITANALKPPECSSLNLDTIVVRRRYCRQRSHPRHFG